MVAGIRTLSSLSATPLQIEPQTSSITDLKVALIAIGIIASVAAFFVLPLLEACVASTSLLGAVWILDDITSKEKIAEKLLHKALCLIETPGSLTEAIDATKEALQLSFENPVLRVKILKCQITALKKRAHQGDYSRLSVAVDLALRESIPRYNRKLWMRG